MKTTLIFLFIIAMTPVIGQQSLYISGSIGQSKYYSRNLSYLNMTGFSLNPVLSGGLDATFEHSNLRIIRPYAGVGIKFLGSLNKTEAHYPINPGKSYYYRHIYVAVPIGINITVYKWACIDIALINSWHVNNQWSIMGSPRTWDLAIKPGAFVSLEKWRVGLSFYYGIRDVFDIGKLDEINDWRLFNKAMHFNVAYKLKTFGKK